jgi:cytochrome c-type biogenesis protein
LGLLTVFAGIGVLTGVFGSVIGAYSRLYGVLAGIIVIVLGILLLVGARFPAFAPPRAVAPVGGNLSLFSFGVGYGLAVTSCTAPILLSIVVFAAGLGGVAQSVLFCSAYALGAGIPLVVTGILVAKSRDVTLRRLKRATPAFSRAAAFVVIAAGLYIIYTSIS